jgi:hypothetical protein
MTFKINGKTFTGFAGGISAAREQLIAYRKRTPKRKDLEWEISVYDYILGSSDPEAYAMAYFKARKRYPHGPKAKRQAISHLGWGVP